MTYTGQQAHQKSHREASSSPGKAEGSVRQGDAGADGEWGAALGASVSLSSHHYQLSSLTVTDIPG